MKTVVFLIRVWYHVYKLNIHMMNASLKQGEVEARKP